MGRGSNQTVVIPGGSGLHPRRKSQATSRDLFTLAYGHTSEDTKTWSCIVGRFRCIACSIPGVRFSSLMLWGPTENVENKGAPHTYIFFSSFHWKQGTIRNWRELFARQQNSSCGDIFIFSIIVPRRHQNRETPHIVFMLLDLLLDRKRLTLPIDCTYIAVEEFIFTLLSLRFFLIIIDHLSLACLRKHIADHFFSVLCDSEQIFHLSGCLSKSQRQRIFQ